MSTQSLHSLSLSPTQITARDLLNDPTIVKLLFGGGAGGAKTMLVCIWMLEQMRDYPGIHILLGRKELVRLKQTTVVTLLSKAHPLMKIKPHSFIYNDQKGLISYRNGSQIQLVDMARQPSDPDFDTFGSLEGTHCVIEEVGQITKKAVDVLDTRKNRFLNTEYGLVGKTVLTCNPTQNFIREEYYEPYDKLGGGVTQKWEDGEIELPTGEMATAYKAFVRSLAADNPFISRNYIETLKKAPPAERKRLLEGNWDYDDNDKLLISQQILDRSMTDEKPDAEVSKLYIGVDVADKGNDKSVLSLIEDDTLTDQIEIDVDLESQIPISHQIGYEVIKYAQQHGMSASNAKQIAYDEVGIGAALRDYFKSKGWTCLAYNGGSSSETDGYNNLRSETFWQTREDMESGKLKILNTLSTMSDLRKQLKAHEYDYDNADRILKIRPKKLVKEDIGRSPDNADSLVIARWAKVHKLLTKTVIW